MDLTEAMITAAMAKAKAHICAPGGNRCYAFPSDVESARASCTPKGRCNVGWVVRASGRESWDVWLEVATGLVKIAEKANA